MTLPTASGLDRAVACPGSVTLPQAPSTGAAAAAGSAIHAYLADPAAFEPPLPGRGATG